MHIPRDNWTAIMRVVALTIAARSTSELLERFDSCIYIIHQLTKFASATISDFPKSLSSLGTDFNSLKNLFVIRRASFPSAHYKGHIQETKTPSCPMADNLPTATMCSPRFLMKRVHVIKGSCDIHVTRD